MDDISARINFRLISEKKKEFFSSAGMANMAIKYQNEQIHCVVAYNCIGRSDTCEVPSTVVVEMKLIG